MADTVAHHEGLQTLAGKRVLVTGGTTGIGRAIAKHLVDVNARVLIYGRHQAELDDALSEMQSGEAHGLTADQSRPEDVQRVFQAVDERLGGLDALVNNAAEGGQSVVETPLEEWTHVVQENLVGYMMCAAEAVRRMQGSGGGRIVNVGSMSAKIAEAGSDVYVATKAGIRGFSDSLGKKVAENGIGVTLVEPGLVYTELTNDDEEQARERLEKMEMIYADDIARAVLFVLSQPQRCLIPLLQVRPLMQTI